MLQLQSGQTLGGWTVDHVLAYGEPALVAVHRTEDPSRRATLRVAEERPLTRSWMRRELAALQSFDDINIPRPIEADTDDGVVFLAVQPFSGDSISDRLVAGHHDWRQSCAWLYQIAKTLQHIHEQGWAHRAINPQSVYVGGDGKLWLMGFEYAVHDSDQAERARTFAGNMAYVAPEVLREPGYHAARADLYSFGLVAYEVLCGEPAFPAATWAERADRERTLLEWKTRASALDPGSDVPSWLRSLVQKCTHPDSDQRLPDMESVVSWLEASRVSWEAPVETPAAFLPTAELPKLRVQPTLIDATQLAEAIAARTAHLQRDRSREEMFYLSVSAMMGCVAGLSLSALAVIFIELSRV